MRNKQINFRLKKVFLKFYEIAMGKFVADFRMSESKRMNLQDRNTNLRMTEDHNIEINYQGVLAEIAVAKYLNQYFGGTVNTFHSLADVGNDVEVRSSKRAGQDLIVRDKDPEDAWYFMVIQQNEETYKIAGFIRGTDAKQEKYWMSPNSRPKAYFIKQEDLIKPSLENLRKHGLML